VNKVAPEAVAKRIGLEAIAPVAASSPAMASADIRQIARWRSERRRGEGSGAKTGLGNDTDVLLRLAVPDRRAASGG
jgi:hypothetical protein